MIQVPTGMVNPTVWGSMTMGQGGSANNAEGVRGTRHTLLFRIQGKLKLLQGDWTGAQRPESRRDRGAPLLHQKTSPSLPATSPAPSVAGAAGKPHSHLQTVLTSLGLHSALPVSKGAGGGTLEKNLCSGIGGGQPGRGEDRAASSRGPLGSQGLEPHCSGGRAGAVLMYLRSGSYMLPQHRPSCKHLQNAGTAAEMNHTEPETSFPPP